MATIATDTTTLASATAVNSDVPLKISSPSMNTKLSGIAQPKKTRWTLIASLSCMAVAIFVADILLLGHTGEARKGWFSAEAVQIWDFVRSSNCFALDCSCTVFLLALIGLKVSNRLPTGRGKSSNSPRPASRHPSPPKSNKQGGQRHKEPSATGTGHAGAASGGGAPASKVRNSVPERSGQVAQWNQAIDLAARQGDPAKAGRLLKEFERQDTTHKPDTVSYNLVIRAYAKKGDYQGAEEWLIRMETSGLEATVCSYNTVLDANAKANNAEGCEQWLQRMISKGAEANVISYATVIYAWARRGDEAHAALLLKKMIDAGIEPDAVSYNSMIHACGVSGNPAGAEHWVQEMLARGLVATVTTFTAVIDACAKCGDVPRAENMLEEMIKAKVQPNVVTFSSMIDACAKASDLTRAEYWHNRMVECNVKPNAHTISAVINACAKAGDVGKAEEWLGRSEEDGIATDVVVYSSVIDACGKVGEAERARAVFERMQAHGIQPHIVAYAALARPYAYRGNWQEVESIAQEMAGRGISANEYFLYAQLLSYATSRPRQAVRAESCFRQALKSGVKANDHVVSALVRAVGRERCTELMQELCNGRSVPQPPARRDGGAHGNKVKPLPQRQ